MSTSLDGRINRRKFIEAATICAGCAVLPLGFSYERADFFGLINTALAENKKKEALTSSKLHEALFYKKLQNNRIECQLCPRNCTVTDKERGHCEVRENRDGIYYTLVYGNPCTTNIDPIEKKPFFHYLPGSTAFSLATAGCNIDCKFCQNWQISQARPEAVKSMKLSPSEIADLAIGYNCQSIAYTYSEPTVFYEYVRDCAIEGQKRGLNSAVISNGFIQAEPLNELLPHLKAMKVDLKSFSQKYYSDICNADLQPVLDTIKLLKKSGLWLEIVYLMLPTLNDSPQEIQSLSKWILNEIGPDVPIHFTRFHPEYLLTNLPPTPVESLECAYEIAKKNGINFPYVGNVYGHRYENTYCPKCQAEIIVRSGFKIQKLAITEGRCELCGRNIPGVWS